MNNILVNSHVFIFKIDNGKIYLLVKRENKKISVPKYKYDGKDTLEKNIKTSIKTDININNIVLNQCHVFSNKNIIDILYVGYIKEEKIKEGYQFCLLEEIDNKMICKEITEYLKENLVKIEVIKKILPEEFSLRELQDIYEKLLDIKLDRRNFRKRLINLHIITETLDYKKKDTNGRPNKLYKFTDIKNILLV